jgi:SagB-type dehydrogenase family enzyme
MIDPSELGESFHLATRNLSVTHEYHSAFDIHFDPAVQRLVSEAPLEFPESPVTPLPSGPMPAMSLAEAILSRRSGRAYGAGPLSLETLGTLLSLINRVKKMDELDGIRSYSRNVPNSGNLGSIEVFPIVLRVESLPEGVYHYDSVRHQLCELQTGDFRSWLEGEALYQVEFPNAAVTLALTCAFGRLRAKYGPRGYRLGYLDAGHVSENAYLAATALSLAVCATAGFIDEAFDSLLGIDGLDTATVLVLLIG